MANYYVDFINGSNLNDGLTPTTAWKEIEYAGNNVSDLNSNVFLMSDNECIIDGTVTYDINILSYDGNQKTIDIKAGRQRFLRNCYSIKFTSTQDLSTTVSPYLDIGLHSKYYKCDFIFENLAYVYTFAVSDAFFSDCMFISTSSKLEFIGDTSFNKCIFKNTMLNFDASSIQMSFNNCIFDECFDELTANMCFDFAREVSNYIRTIFKNCSIKLLTNQDCVVTSNFNSNSVQFINCIVESPDSNSQVYRNLEDISYIALENSVLVNCIASNPTYSINVSNLQNETVTQFKQINDSTLDTYFALTDTAVARNLDSSNNTDAGAKQAAPLVIFPATTDVRNGVTYGNGASGDRTGVYEPAPVNKVEDSFQYGANGTEFTGTLTVIQPPNDYDLREGITVGSVVGTLKVPAKESVESTVEYDAGPNLKVGEMVPLAPQQGNYRVVIYTSNGTNISGSFASPTHTYYAPDGKKIDDILIELGVSERLGSGAELVRNTQNPQFLDIRLNRA